MRAWRRPQLSRYDVDTSGTPLFPAVSLLNQAVTAAIFTGVLAWLLNRLEPNLIAWIPFTISMPLLTVIAQEGPQRLIGGGRLDNRPMVRAALALTMFACVLNSAGTGFLLPISGVLIGAVHVQWSGSRAWLPIAKVTVAMTLLNQLVLAGGLTHGLLSPWKAFAATLLGLALAVLGQANIGLSAKRQEELVSQLADTEARFRTLVQNSSDVVTVMGLDGILTFVSPASDQILGIPSGDLEGRPLLDLVNPEDASQFQAQIAAVTENSASDPAASVLTTRWEARLNHPEEEPRWLEFSATCMVHDPVINGVVVHIREVTQRREFQDQLAYSATHDPLTGLTTREEFIRTTRHAIAAAGPGAAVAVLFCDLDKFKAVNDTLGHSAGDEVLIETARRLRTRLRAHDMLGRMGGDEFTVCLTGLPSPAIAEQIADQLRAAAEVPITLSSGRETTVGMSIGVAIVEDPSQDADQLLSQADQAMYAMKKGAVRVRRGGVQVDQLPGPRSAPAGRTPRAST
jgi:diguanylate cyclase (GGDEF)-like protein/PAS domain S-box-containing protein